MPKDGPKRANDSNRKEITGTMLRQYRVRDYDFKLIILVVALTIIGIFAVGSADESLQKDTDSRVYIRDVLYGGNIAF